MVKGEAGSHSRPWGDGIAIRYRVSSDKIEVAAPHGEVFMFDTPDNEPGFPFSSTAIHEILDESAQRKQELRIFVPTVDGVELSYLRRFFFNDYEAMPGEDFQGYYIFGIVTENKDMPLNGSAQYKSFVGGTAVMDSSVFQFSSSYGSTASFSANFGSGEVETELHLIGQPFPSTHTVDFGTFTATGLINGASFGGIFNGVPGEFNGAFFGPGAAEMGYGFFFVDDTVRFRGDVVGIKE